MITEQEQKFIQHWEEVRIQRSSFGNKLISGLPMAVMFGLPIILSVIAIRIFLPDWYTKISNSFSGSFIIIIIAVLIAVVFYAYFRMHFKWEMNEQLFQQLKAKEKKQSPSK